MFNLFKKGKRITKPGAVTDSISSTQGKQGVSVTSFKNLKTFTTFYSNANWTTNSKSVGRWFKSDTNDFQNNTTFKESHSSFNNLGGFDLKENDNDAKSEPVLYEDIPKEFAVFKNRLPPTLILCLSDKDPYHLFNKLDNLFSKDTIKTGMSTFPLKGIIATKTPFENGLPFTLFKDDQVFSKGLVGIALNFEINKEDHTENSMCGFLQFNNLIEFDNEYEITSCRGNIITSLNGQNATSSLLRELHSKSGIVEKSIKTDNIYRTQEEEEDFKRLFIKVYHYNDPKKFNVLEINSGDPSKGFLSVKTVLDLKSGMRIKFAMLNNSHKQIHKHTLSKSFIEFRFTNIMNSIVQNFKKDISKRDLGRNDETIMVEESKLICWSDEGLIVDGKNNLDGKTRIIDIPGSTYRVKF
ncbi:hypothetical protein HK099_002438 [Clydaea vesicula]|uniref:Uncharacterized protein n=1 Tax=Clydaea vesicula TaxID=447962 RepID=A0AAD5U2G3_9FUNG|nr:hypothetical protein HK099_002438 [Clydaea vesicula]